jgi:hypothetical protein
MKKSSKRVTSHIKTITKRFTLFDISILFFAVAVLAIFFVFFYRKSEFITIRVKVTDQDVLYAATVPQNWYAERFEVGDVELDAAGRKIAEITNVYRYNVGADKQAVYLDLSVKATYDTRSKTYSARGKTIRFGAPMRFNLSKITFDGLVTEFPGSDQNQTVETGSVTIKVLGRGVEPYLATSFAVGDTMLDSNNTILAEITRVEIVPAERVTSNTAGDLLLRRDPLYKDVYIEVKLKTKTVNGVTYIFDDIPLKIGETVGINLKQVSLAPQIVEIYE